MKSAGIDRPGDRHRAQLRANGFKTFIVPGGGVEFMRAFAEITYGVPPEQVIGSGGKLKFEMRDSGPVLIKLLKIDVVDDNVENPLPPETYWPPPDRILRKFRRRPGDAAMDCRWKWRALRIARPPQ